MDNYNVHNFKPGDVLMAQAVNDIDNQTKALTDEANRLQGEITRVEGIFPYTVLGEV